MTIQDQILHLLARLRVETGVSQVLVTHDLAVVAQTCERVAVMYAARIVETGTVAEVFGAPRHPYTRALLRSVPDFDERRAHLESIAGMPPDLVSPPVGLPLPPALRHRARRLRDHRPAAHPHRRRPRDTACRYHEELARVSAELRCSRCAASRCTSRSTPRSRGGCASSRSTCCARSTASTCRSRRGEALGLVGESGCGKSTLGRCIVGLYEPTEGQVLVEGHALPAKRTAADRRRVQMIFQDPYSSLNPRMTVHQALAELLRVHKLVPRAGIDARCRELLDLVGLPPSALDAYPRQFSGGQRQRISIARALALEPEILIADEPVSALDVSVQATVLNLLADLRRRLGLTMLFVAHNMAVVRHVCDRVAVMYLGRIVETAPSDQLFSDARHPYTQALLRAVPRLAPGHATVRDAVVGDPPSPVNLPPGCRFNPRCPRAEEICRELDPPLEFHGVHGAACHFAWNDPRREH